MSDGENIEMTSDCWSGTWASERMSAFDGNPEACSAVQPDGILQYEGTVDADLSEIGIAGDVACLSDATFTITGRSRGLDTTGEPHPGGSSKVGKGMGNGLADALVTGKDSAIHPRIERRAIPPTTTGPDIPGTT
uniref:Uncharacterized protein n=1 Tax=Emericella variicolor TaxID=1549217 RepID=A0A1V1G1B7_EMEVA|nr:hypothetical protein [Aspergillus stellatus]